MSSSSAKQVAEFRRSVKVVQFGAHLQRMAVEVGADPLPIGRLVMRLGVVDLQFVRPVRRRILQPRVAAAALAPHPIR
jgi:hypothetical protein